MSKVIWLRNSALDKYKKCLNFFYYQSHFPSLDQGSENPELPKIWETPSSLWLWSPPECRELKRFLEKLYIHWSHKCLIKNWYVPGTELVPHLLGIQDFPSQVLRPPSEMPPLTGSDGGLKGVALLAWVCMWCRLMAPPLGASGPMGNSAPLWIAWIQGPILVVSGSAGGCWAGEWPGLSAELTW